MERLQLPCSVAVLVNEMVDEDHERHLGTVPGTVTYADRDLIRVEWQGGQQIELPNLDEFLFGLYGQRDWQPQMVAPGSRNWEPVLLVDFRSAYERCMSVRVAITTDLIPQLCGIVAQYCD